ncbi:MAG: hypothetical protein WDM79_18960 [Terricaulis sp.]
MGANNMAALTSQNIVALADPDFDHVAAAMLDRRWRATPRSRSAENRVRKRGEIRRLSPHVRRAPRHRRRRDRDARSSPRHRRAHGDGGAASMFMCKSR